MTELRQLTGARGIAAWAVVLYHLRLSIAGLPAPAVAALGKGYLAVDFFFLLSGFVIWLAWHERLRPALPSRLQAAFSLASRAREGAFSLPSRAREGLGEGMSAATHHPIGRALPQPLPHSGRGALKEPLPHSGRGALRDLFPHCGRGVHAETLRFWQKRVARIWPLHLAMLSLAVALAALLSWRGRADPAFPWGELPLHLLLIQNWGFTSGLHWNDPAWSISAELTAYLLFPLLVRAVDWQRWTTPLLVAAMAVALLAIPLVAGWGRLGDGISRFGLLRCLAEFTAGTAIAALFQRGGRAMPPLLTGLALLAAAIAGAPETLAVPPAFAALLLALARSRARLLASAPVHWLGEISYATYLSHFLLWKAAKLLLPAGPQPPPVIAAYLLAVLVASHLLYRRLELPAQRWVNALPLLRRNEGDARALTRDGHQDRLLR